MRLAAHKLPIKTKFVKRDETDGESNESWWIEKFNWDGIRSKIKRI
jgi:hypothetical protein